MHNIKMHTAIHNRIIRDNIIYRILKLTSLNKRTASK